MISKAAAKASVYMLIVSLACACCAQIVIELLLLGSLLLYHVGTAPLEAPCAWM
jgi:hypothetical protein